MAYSALEAGDCPPTEEHNLPLSAQSVLQVLKDEAIPDLIQYSKQILCRIQNNPYLCTRIRHGEFGQKG